MTTAIGNLTQEAGSWHHWISRRAGFPSDFGIVCLWSFLGLDLTAFAIALGFGAEITDILSIAG